MDDETTERGAETGSTNPRDPKDRVGFGETRLFGAVPPTLALCLGVAGLILGVVLLITGSLVAGVIWLLAGLCLLAVGVDSARRWPASALPRLVVSGARASVRRLGLARVSAVAWSEASRRRFGLRRELRGLRKRRAAEVSALGAAAYEEHTRRMRTLRGRIAELDGRIAGCERAMADAVERARDRVQRKRAEIQPTQPQSA
ncbi:MAG TPA: hypothetical protein VIZ61_13145 [Solirubrobacterales bacterium]